MGFSSYQLQIECRSLPRATHHVQDAIHFDEPVRRTSVSLKKRPHHNLGPCECQCFWRGAAERFPDFRTKTEILDSLTRDRRPKADFIGYSGSRSFGISVASIRGSLF
jgi:hypothetical protein